MKKILAVTALMLLMVAFFAACANEFSEPQFDLYAPRPREGEAWHDGPVRGQWNGNVYENEYMGLRFTSPDGWNIFSEADIVSFFNFLRPENLELVDMVTYDPTNYASVQITYMLLEFPLSRFTTADFVGVVVENASQANVAYAHDEPVIIGDREWYSYRVYSADGVPSITEYFVRVENGVAMMILIIHDVSEDPVELLLSGFASYDSPAAPPPPMPTPPPPPTPPPVQGGEVYTALVGSWVWTDSYHLVFEFRPDGTGRGGFYPHEMDEFNWGADMDDYHLMLSYIDGTESWTISFEDDMVTMQSREYDDLLLSFVSWQGPFISSDPLADLDIDLTGHELLGTWYWDGDPAYIFNFRADGTVTRGFAGSRNEQTWVAYEDFLLIDVGGFVQEWEFVIVDDVLTIDSLQQAGITWSYIRE